MLDAAVSRDFPAVITYKVPSTWLDRWNNMHDPRHQGKDNLFLAFDEVIRNVIGVGLQTCGVNFE